MSLGAPMSSDTHFACEMRHFGGMQRKHVGLGRPTVCEMFYEPPPNGKEPISSTRLRCSDPMSASWSLVIPRRGHRCPCR